MRRPNIHGVYAPFLRYFRPRRMQRFVEEFQPTDETTILDVGGSPLNWDAIEAPFDVTLLNLPTAKVDGRGRYKFVEGDARELDFPDGAFDIGFSNSVIEHVGSTEDQERYAQEIRRVGRSLWVQTPALAFPIEPHYVTPFIHWVPSSWRWRLLRNFTVWGWITRPSPERARERVGQIQLVSRAEFARMFPDCEIRTERFLGLPKAYVAVRRRG